MGNVVITVTPPLAASVAETECISHHTGQTTGPGPLLTAAEIAYCHKTLPLFAGLCQLFKHCCVVAAKRYVQHSNLGRNSGNSGRLLTSLFQNFDVFGTFCERKYAHLDVNRNTDYWLQ